MLFNNLDSPEPQTEKPNYCYLCCKYMSELVFKGSRNIRTEKF